jgi:hypothetical protein
LSETDTFEQARFVRILGIRAASTTPGKLAGYLPSHPDHPTYRLKPRSSYELVIFHAQPAAPPQPSSFQVFVDGSDLRTLGTGQFTVASRYDEVPIPLATAEPAGLENRDTTIVLEPGQGVQGPMLSLTIRIEANRRRAIGIASTQALALMLVALAGVLTSAPLGIRIGIAGIGALAAVALGLLGSSALRPPTMPSAAPRMPARANSRV